MVEFHTHEDVKPHDLVLSPVALQEVGRVSGGLGGDTHSL